VLASADLDLFAAFHFQQQAAIEIGFYFFDEPQVDDMFCGWRGRRPFRRGVLRGRSAILV